jgi:flagellar hook-length control protein FliK
VQQPGSSTAGSPDLAPAVVAATDALDPTATNGASPPPAKATSGAAAGKDDDGTDDADAGSAAPAGSQAPPAAPSQPVAAAVLVNAAFDATPAAANASAPRTRIDEWSRSRGSGALPPGGDQDAPAQDANGATAQPTAASDSSGATAGDSGSSGSTAAVAAPDAGAAPQSQAQTDDTAAVLGQTAGISQGGTDRVAPRGDALAGPPGAAGTSTAPSTPGAANTLPNFGFFAANATATNAAAATPASDSAAGVPITGLAVAIAARAQGGSNQFDIRLDPPELGRIDVRLDVDGNGQVTSHVTVDRADTLQLLQSQQPQLERALEQAGLKTADNGLQFTLRDQSFAGQNGNGAGPQNTAQLVIPDADLPAIDTTQIYSRLSLGTGIDIRV